MTATSNSIATTTTASPSLPKMNLEDWAAISSLPGNSNCMDCNAQFPEWGSVNFGILFCTRCSSGHRSLGTHTSCVRSVKMDAWTGQQVTCMKAGGNQSCMDWLHNNGIALRSPPKAKYDNEIARLYSEVVIQARIEGRQEPKSVEDAKRLQKWNHAKEWWARWREGSTIVSPAIGIIRKPQTVLQRIQSVTSSSDFTMVAYFVTLFGVPSLFVAWLYR